MSRNPKLNRHGPIERTTTTTNSWTAAILRRRGNDAPNSARQPRKPPTVIVVVATIIITLIIIVAPFRASMGEACVVAVGADRDLCPHLPALDDEVVERGSIRRRPRLGPHLLPRQEAELLELHGPLVVHGRGLPEGATEVGPIRDALAQVDKQYAGGGQDKICRKLSESPAAATNA